MSTEHKRPLLAFVAVFAVAMLVVVGAARSDALRLLVREQTAEMVAAVTIDAERRVMVVPAAGVSLPDTAGDRAAARDAHHRERARPEQVGRDAAQGRERAKGHAHAKPPGRAKGHAHAKAPGRAKGHAHARPPGQSRARAHAAPPARRDTAGRDSTGQGKAKGHQQGRGHQHGNGQGHGHHRH